MGAPDVGARNCAAYLSKLWCGNGLSYDVKETDPGVSLHHPFSLTENRGRGKECGETLGCNLKRALGD